MATSGVLAYRATYLLFALSLPLYIWYRWTHTVAWDADSNALCAYQAAVALVELFGGVSVLLLGAVRFPRPWAPPNPQPPQSPQIDASDPESIRGFQVSILIPCYSEPDEIILGAVRAALGLRHPLASRVTVYLLDDGGRPERAAAVRALGAQYVSRPKDPSKPRHGKAGNLNYFFRGVLCGGARPLCEGGVPGPEHVVAVFDCDMEAHADFLGHTLPYLAAEPRVALVQTPQAFFNVAPAADIFNHNNVGFFQAVQPGLDAWGATVCCGTNFAVRAAALHEVGWFPTESITEDFLLSLKLAAAGHVCRYHAAVVSTGEAPEDLRQIFKQRSRWCAAVVVPPPTPPLPFPPPGSHLSSLLPPSQVHRLLPGLLPPRDVGDARAAALAAEALLPQRAGRVRLLDRHAAGVARSAGALAVRRPPGARAHARARAAVVRDVRADGRRLRGDAAPPQRRVLRLRRVEGERRLLVVLRRRPRRRARRPRVPAPKGDLPGD